MSTIQISCIDQVLTFQNMPVVSSGDVGSDSISFTFCSQWNGYARIAVFYQTTGQYYFSLLDNTDTCTIPSQAISSEGITHIGVVGVNGNLRKTSNVLRYEIVEGAYSATPEEPSPNIYEQILAELLAIRSEVDEFESDFEELPYIHMDGENAFQYDTPAFDAEVLSVVSDVVPKMECGEVTITVSDASTTSATSTTQGFQKTYDNPLVVATLRAKVMPAQDTTSNAIVKAFVIDAGMGDLFLSFKISSPLSTVPLSTGTYYIDYIAMEGGTDT